MIEQDDYEEEREEEIEISKSYNLPKEIVVRKQGEHYLVIYTEGILWLVCNNEEELKAFEMLQKGYSIEETLEVISEEPVINVVTQLEAKDFEHPKRNYEKDRNIYIYLTNNCNQRCRHCYMYAGDVQFDELSSDQWIEILDDFKKSGGSGVTFTGGEVTVYRDFETIVKYAHKIGLSVTVLTNGILWDKSKIQRIGDCIDEVQISIDGYDKTSYFNVRQHDGFEKAVQTVKDFSDFGTKVSIAITPLYDDLGKVVEKLEPFAQKLMNDYPQVFIKCNLELIPGRNINVTDDDNKEYKRLLREMVERLYPGFYTETFALNYENHVLRRNCGFGEISIAADGQVFWCNRIHELNSRINILDTNFRDLFAESDRVVEDTSVDNTSGCKDCDIRYICGGGCRLKYKGIEDADIHIGEWEYTCEGKEIIYDKMIKCNEYFFE